MFPSNTVIEKASRLGRKVLAIAVACAALSGCQQLDCGCNDNPTAPLAAGPPAPKVDSSWLNQFRPADPQMKPFSVTNRGMEIERSLGVR